MKVTNEKAGTITEVGPHFQRIAIENADVGHPADVTLTGVTRLANGKVGDRVIMQYRETSWSGLWYACPMKLAKCEACPKMIPAIEDNVREFDVYICAECWAERPRDPRYEGLAERLAEQ